MKDARHSFGQLGEDRAVAYLEGMRYRILDRNFRTKTGEIDIVAEKDSTLIFVEVKTRSSLRFGEGYEAVNSRKQKKLRQLALIYLSEKEIFGRAIRFDVISLLFSREGELLKLQHFEEAF